MTLLFPKGHQFLDVFGDPASGGTLFIYEHQTTMLMPLYQNPIPLTVRTYHSLWSRIKDMAAEPGGRILMDIYIDRDCDILLKDCNGATVWMEKKILVDDGTELKA